MSVNAPNTIAEAPAARPSSPSVRFTAFDVAVMIRYATTTNPTVPSPISAMSRT